MNLYIDLGKKLINLNTILHVLYTSGKCGRFLTIGKPIETFSCEVHKWGNIKTLLDNTPNFYYIENWGWVNVENIISLDFNEHNTTYTLIYVDTLDRTNLSKARIPQLNKGLYDFVKDYKKSNGKTIECTYTNELGATVDVGGIKKGTIFKNASNQEMWDSLLSPEPDPIITNFFCDKQYLELGETLDERANFFWNINNPQKIKDINIYIGDKKLKKITDKEYILQPDDEYKEDIKYKEETEGVEKSKDEEESVPVEITPNSFVIEPITKDTSFLLPCRLEILTIDNHTINKGFNFEWLDAVYYGSLDEEKLGVFEKNNFNYFLADRIRYCAIRFNESGYKYICIPNMWQDLKNFTDKSTGLKVPMIHRQNIEITNEFNITQNYKVYRTVNLMHGSIIIKIL